MKAHRIIWGGLTLIGTEDQPIEGSEQLPAGPRFDHHQLHMIEILNPAEEEIAKQFFAEFKKFLEEKFQQDEIRMWKENIEIL